MHFLRSVDSSYYRSSGVLRLPEPCAEAAVAGDVSGVAAVMARSSRGDRRLPGCGCWEEGGVTSSTEWSWCMRYWWGDWRARCAQCNSSRCNSGRFAWQTTHAEQLLCVIRHQGYCLPSRILTDKKAGSKMISSSSSSSLKFYSGLSSNATTRTTIRIG